MDIAYRLRNFYDRLKILTYIKTKNTISLEEALLNQKALDGFHFEMWIEDSKVQDELVQNSTAEIVELILRIHKSPLSHSLVGLLGKMGASVDKMLDAHQVNLNDKSEEVVLSALAYINEHSSDPKLRSAFVEALIKLQTGKNASKRSFSYEVQQFCPLPAESSRYYAAVLLHDPRSLPNEVEKLPEDLRRAIADVILADDRPNDLSYLKKCVLALTRLSLRRPLLLDLFRRSLQYSKVYPDAYPESVRFAFSKLKGLSRDGLAETILFANEYQASRFSQHSISSVLQNANMADHLLEVAYEADLTKKRTEKKILAAIRYFLDRGDARGRIGKRLWEMLPEDKSEIVVAFFGDAFVRAVKLTQQERLFSIHYKPPIEHRREYQYVVSNSPGRAGEPLSGEVCVGVDVSHEPEFIELRPDDGRPE